MKGHFDPSLHLIAIDIVVYDIAKWKRVVTIEISPQQRTDYDFALSPDGTKLAVLNNGRLSVYAVPAI